MTKEPFQPFNLDLDDQLERIAQAKGVPALTTKPAIAAQATTLNHTAEEGAQQTLPPASQGPPTLPAEPPPSERMEARVKVPDYLMTELKIATIHRRVSLNHLFLSGLRAIGFTVHDEDMIEDGRRLRGKNSPNHTSRSP
ncbi:hypothetical protein [Hyphomicrobium zavarzinii]|uniref:hypothetical protein n=1 Tax=Hyphomicrobium zavarzinii TaxID=48292 RepID=UPI0012EC0F38|nr:hypothetical protein [Hyphomicrobium zavarzinii]